jgi:hypothetical protein
MHLVTSVVQVLNIRMKRREATSRISLDFITASLDRIPKLIGSLDGECQSASSERASRCITYT